MSKKPVLVIMAAGMGSRYGGLKQIDPVDPYGNMIIDFSIYDAKQAGFEKVIFIIKKAIDEAFREGIGKRIEKYMDVEYVYQELDVLPKGYEVPEGRVKPFQLDQNARCEAPEVHGNDGSLRQSGPGCAIILGVFGLSAVVFDSCALMNADKVVLVVYDNWYGVTYKEDKENVMAALQKLKDEGRYPQKLWEE